MLILRGRLSTDLYRGHSSCCYCPTTGKFCESMAVYHKILRGQLWLFFVISLFDSSFKTRGSFIASSSCTFSSLPLLMSTLDLTTQSIKSFSLGSILLPSSKSPAATKQLSKTCSARTCARIRSNFEAKRLHDPRIKEVCA